MGRAHLLKNAKCNHILGTGTKASLSNDNWHATQELQEVSLVILKYEASNIFQLND